MSRSSVVVVCAFWIGVFLCSDIVSGGEGVRIKEIRVPDVVLNGTEEPVVLDCVYVLDTPTPPGLVVKWFFNNHPAPVYQWIVNQRPQDLGVLKGKVNLGYKATSDKSTMHRAINILTPTIELSGDYKCLVSTFDQEDSRSKKMIVYVPERSLEVTQKKPKDDQVTINCEAEGVYPEPNMTIVALDTKHGGYIQVTTKKQNNSSLFDIRGSLTVDDAELESPTTFSCELSIPGTNHTKKRKLVYFPASGSALTSSLIPVMSLSVIVLLSNTAL